MAKDKAVSNNKKSTRRSVEASVELNKESAPQVSTVTIPGQDLTSLATKPLEQNGDSIEGGSRDNHDISVGTDLDAAVVSPSENDNSSEGVIRRNLWRKPSKETVSFFQKGNKRRRLMLATIIIGVLLLGAGSMVMAMYGHCTIRVAIVESQIHNQPLKLVFERPIRNSVTYTWREKIEGSWKTEKSVGGIKTLSFTPKTRFVPGAQLHLELDHIRPVIDVWSGTSSRQTVRVDIQKAPNIKSITPKNGAQNVLIDSELAVVLASKNHDLRRIELAGDLPLASKSPQTTDDITFRWKLAAPLEQGKAYKADIIDLNQAPAQQKIGAFDFQTVAEPQVQTGFNGFLRPGNKLAINFDQDMDQAATKIEFSLPGTGNWTGPREYVYQAGAVEPGRSYAYKVLKGTKSTVGGFVIEDKIYTVSTPGAVTVIGARPTGARIGLDAPISLTFNQPVDHASAEAAFSLSPQVAGSFAWSGNTMTFRPTGYGYQTTYSYGVAAGIKPEFGLPGTGYGAQFTTVYEVKKLPMPFYRQAHALSCEAASLRMALAYYGVMTNDDEILGRIGYAPEPRNTETNSWQDPYQMFVGNVDGALSKTGWGVYAPPVAKAARSFGRSAEILNGPTSAQVAAAIHSGAPVVIWGVAAGAAPVRDSWNTTTSGVVQAARNQHVRIAYGVEGSADNPVGFYINDPLRGSVYWSAGALQYNMNGGGAQALIVR